MVLLSLNAAMGQSCQPYYLCLNPVVSGPPNVNRTYELVLHIPGGSLNNLSAVNFSMTLGFGAQIVSTQQLYQGPPNVPLSLGQSGTTVSLINVFAMNGAIMSGTQIPLFSVTFTGNVGQCVDVQVSETTLYLLHPTIFPCYPSVCPQGSSHQECFPALQLSGRIESIPAQQCTGSIDYGVPGVEVPVIRAGQTLCSEITANNGSYSCAVGGSENSTIVGTPLKNDNVNCGLTTMDYILMRQHILSVGSLNRYHQLVAGDVTGDGMISTLDLIHLNAAILGTPLPGFQAWKFITAPSYAPYYYAVPEPFLTMLPAFTTYYTLANLSSNQPNLDFVGIKTGDINQTCTDCGGLQMRSDNTTAPLAFSASFRISTPTAPVHSEVLVPVYAQTPLEVGAMNIDWTFDAGRFVLQDIVWAGLRANEISNVVIESNRLRMIWGAMKPFEVVNADEPLFYLKGYVVKQTALGGAFVEMIPGDETNVVIDDYLRLRPIQIAENTDFDVSVFPNPFGQSTSFLLDLPDSGPLDIRIFSADGRLLETHRLDLPAGLHTWHWPGADQAPAGLLLYQIDSPSGRRSGKLLKSK